MQSITKILTILSFLVFIFSCNSKETPIKTAFIEARYTAVEEGPIFLKDHLDQESIQFLEDLGKYSRTESYDFIETFGESVNAPMSIMMLYSVANQHQAMLSGVENEVLMYIVAQFTKTGIYNNATSISFKELEKEMEDTAYAKIAIKAAQNTYLETRYKFTKEEGKWKLNFPSTLRTSENLLKQQARKMRLSGRDFVQKVAQGIIIPPEKINVIYKKR